MFPIKFTSFVLMLMIIVNNCNPCVEEWMTLDMPEVPNVSNNAN